MADAAFFSPDHHRVIVCRSLHTRLCPNYPDEHFVYGVEQDEVGGGGDRGRVDRSCQPVQLLRLPAVLSGNREQQVQRHGALVPDPGDHQHPAPRLLKRMAFPTQATNYFDFLTNDDDMKAKYLGGMNNFNFRQYKDID